MENQDYKESDRRAATARHTLALSHDPLGFLFTSNHRNPPRI